MKIQPSTHRTSVIGLILILLLSITDYSFGQIQSKDQLPYIPILGRKLKDLETFQPKYIHKTPGHYTKQDWKQVIDQTWGTGLPTAEKLAIFDRAWNFIDRGYGAFVNLEVNLDSLKKYH